VKLNKTGFVIFGFIYELLLIYQFSADLENLKKNQLEHTVGVDHCRISKSTFFSIILFPKANIKSIHIL